MFSIGEFARHGRVSVRMLRHYDAIGLLRPASVDRDNGYRFYQASQLADLNRIIALKDLGFTLQQVQAILAEQVSAAAAGTGEVFAWLGARGLDPAGPPFLKYNVVDMARQLGNVSTGCACAPHHVRWRARSAEPGRLTLGSVMVVTGLAVAAAVWGVLMGVSPVLQIRRMLRQRSSRDVSVGYFTILLVGFGLWISYGLASRNLALIVPNAVALLIGVSTIAIALRLRNRAGGH
jgi:DNA-binding transcriptional MerR regulator/uncharacterized protein with PQ loop repeat